MIMRTASGGPSPPRSGRSTIGLHHNTNMAVTADSSASAQREGSAVMEMGSMGRMGGALALGIVVGLGSSDGAFAQSGPTKSKETKSEKQKVKTHRLAIQVNENRPEAMNLALNNAKNVIEHFKAQGEVALVEIVTYGPGLHMYRDDSSPVKQRIAQMSLEEPNIAFAACANTQANMSKAEQKSITLVSEAKLVPSGVVRLMELQGKGYACIRP
jgi:uncharacterized protein